MKLQLAPSFPNSHPSPTAAASYTGLFNVLNFPAGVVPVTKVTPKDQSELNDPTIYPAKKMYDKMARKVSLSILKSCRHMMRF